MKNKILILSALILLSGCSGLYHLRKSVKHKEKAIKKGVTIPKDTVTIRTTDTLTQTFIKNDTTYIVKTVTNTVELEPVIEYKTRWQTKYEFKEVKVENKAMIDSLQQVVKIERQKKQTARIEIRGF